MKKKVDSAWFASRLRELRQQSGLTQQQLAEKAGLTRDGIAQIESGKNSPSWATVVRLCHSLGVECAEFMKPPEDNVKPGPGRPKAVVEAEPEKPTKGNRKKGDA